MSHNSTTLVISENSDGKESCLDLYLSADRKKTKANLPGSLADLDSAKFGESLEKLQTKITKFLESASKQKSILVLGKVQSGKTAHMLGTIAWAVNKKIHFGVVFTGINGDLNEQTQARLKSSLESLGENFITTFEVPTSAEGSEYESLKSDIIRMIKTRKNSNEALPVLVTMKNKYRIGTIEKLAGDIATECGTDTVGMYIDDEADQASQNSGSQKRTTSVTYESFTKVRKAGIRNIWLSYTATPQAVLLTEKHGLIRPDFAVVAPPRLGYFGLSDSVSSDFDLQRIVVEDWPHGKKEISTCPTSLKESIHDFFLTSLVRFEFPQFFYSLGDFQSTDIDRRLRSVQMMIHTSNSTVSHKSTFELVLAELSAWKDELTSYQSSRLMGRNVSDTQDELLRSAERLILRVGRECPFNSQDLLSEASLTSLIELIENNNLMIVNADPKRHNKHLTFPNENADWEKARTWIAIGGDILGRGLTLPQLVTTYFMRTSKTPNFDTVSQQMRFCGYRNSYAAITSIWAPQQTFDSFFYMSQIENVVWNRALKWDADNLDIGKNLPTVMYAAPLTSRIEPTRKAVQDPDLVDSKISGELIFSSRRFMNPIHMKRNVSTTTKWLTQYANSFEILNDWLYCESPTIEQVLDLLSRWSARDSELSSLLGVCELFSDDMEGLGLSQIPISIFVTNKIRNVEFGNPQNLEKFNNSIKFGRSVSGESSKANLEVWKQAVLDIESLGSHFDDLAVTHIGGGQRKLKDHIQYDASVVVIEFMNGYKTLNGLKTQVSTGLALSILSPGDYDVRVIGHSK